MAHGHQHSHTHETGGRPSVAVARPAGAAAPAASLLRLSAAQRLGVSAALSALLWLLVAWAMR